VTARVEHSGPEKAAALRMAAASLPVRAQDTTAGAPNFRQRVPPKWQKGAEMVPRKLGVSRGLPLTKFQIGTRPIA